MTKRIIMIIFGGIKVAKRKYYYQHDFYNLENDEELTILTNFKTRQWTIEFACGPNAMLMIMNYFNDFSKTEQDIFKEVHCKQPGGTDIKDIVAFFKKHHYLIETSIDQKPGELIFKTMDEFKKFVINNLKKGYPILVESVYYGGHYQVIIGYDSRTENDGYLNDILIFADSSDETDDYIDGYHYFSAFKFYTMWFDHKFFEEKHRIQPYIVVKGRDEYEKNSS